MASEHKVLVFPDPFGPMIALIGWLPFNPSVGKLNSSGHTALPSVISQSILFGGSLARALGSVILPSVV
jgi:hypothetical protein